MPELDFVADEFEGCWAKVGCWLNGELAGVFPVDGGSSSSLLTCSVDLAKALTALRTDDLSTAQLDGQKSSKAAEETVPSLPILPARGGLRVSLIRQSMTLCTDSVIRLA